jgi:hypothetical protein
LSNHVQDVGYTISQCPNLNMCMIHVGHVTYVIDVKHMKAIPIHITKGV